MSYAVTNDHKQAFRENSIVKLSGVIEQGLLDEISEYFDWSIANPGPIAAGKNAGEDIFFVDYNRDMWGQAGNFSRLPDISAELAANPNSWDIASFDVKPGDVVVLYPPCLHAGGRTDEALRERRNLALRFFGDDYSEHLPDAPGMYDQPPIPAATGGYLKDSDLY